MRRREREARLHDEFELHLEMATEANIRRGMSPDAARRAARLASGAAEHFKDDARDQSAVRCSPPSPPTCDMPRGRRVTHRC